ncbi:MAG TPA: MtsA protein, partial [Myxococcaceae bacterium]
MKRMLAVLTALALCAAAVGLFVFRPQAGAAPHSEEPTPSAARLLSVGPRLTSNQTAQPLAVYGERLEPGMRLALGPPLSRELPLKVVDERHAYTRLPADVTLPVDLPQASVTVKLVVPQGPAPEGEGRLDVVNDAAFPDLFAMALAPDGSTAFVASPPTDTVFAVEVGTGKVTALAVGDGPSALATYKDAGGRPWLAVAHRFSPELRLFALDAPGSEPRVLPAPVGAMGLAVDARGEVAFVAEQ